MRTLQRLTLFFPPDFVFIDTWLEMAMSLVGAAPSAEDITPEGQNEAHFQSVL